MYVLKFQFVVRSATTLKGSVMADMMNDFAPDDLRSTWL